MSINRKTFLKIAASGGVSALVGMTNLLPRFWSERGVNLITVERQSLVMGSVASFKVIAPTKEDGYEAIRKGIEAFREMDRIFSMYKVDSEMMKLAQQSGKEPVKLSDNALFLLRRAREIYQQTRGYFDITIEPAMRRWGFRKDDQSTITPPTDTELKKLEKLIGTEKLIIENNTAMLKNRDMAIDTGGIAGGYALDKAIEAMKKCSIAAAFINFSGDIHCFGEPEKGKGWPVQIYNPNTDGVLSDEIELNNEALSTSGSYQNRRSAGGNKSWGHLLQPAIAQPVEPLSSLTAIHPSATLADAWSTAAYIGATPPEDVKTIVIR